LSNEQGEMKQHQEEHSFDAVQGHQPSGYRPVDHSITGPFQPNVVMGVDSKGSHLLAGDSVRGRGWLVRPYTRVVARARASASAPSRARLRGPSAASPSAT
jgi:hypothetical protein